MRIGIYTQPLTTNYGGMLQNYALQVILKQMGHEVWTVDYYYHNWIDWLDKSFRVFIHKLLGHSITWPVTPKEQKAKEYPLRRFANKYIQLTTPRTKYFSSKTIKDYNFKVLLVGSDQVWRPLYNERIEDMFFAFVHDDRLRRIAYAASFGTDSWEYTGKQTTKCSFLAKRFHAISVREKSGIELCKENLDVDATCVLDPTLLLSSSDYMLLCSNIPIKESFVFAYILDESNEKINEIKKFAQSKEMQYLIMSAGPQICENDSIEKWLSYFRDASYVITDSFHGTAFSINFNKDFFVFGNKKRGNSRIESLLERLDLRERIIDFKIGKQKPINWKNVNRILTEEKKRSIEWLTGSLS